ncbi:sensor histidine kinase [Adhaeribacter rhizoryzae]|uniref:histidine kinase n=1 Tax=Adhaeribacter rhizoryzae TaxID=2607907 RepID=A0A5M6DTS8_9BACT|nr:HAMP domain-containing sensor histidine kinase [Adhaeribacter rhizoryzae]KAA5549550.1 sensor histidine kinase [Adhaeribacter rhizoryzae]
MKLQNKLASYNALSKLIIILIFVLLLPRIVDYQARRQTDVRLRQQHDKVLQSIKTGGIAQYLEPGQDSVFSSYNIFSKEDYITLEQIAPSQKGTYFIETAKREVEGVQIDFRILTNTFRVGNNWYLMELGYSLASVSENNVVIQRFALILLISMVLLTIASDIYFTKYLLTPLNIIVRTKLQNLRSPADFKFPRIKTSTSDFKHLDNSIHEMMERIEQAFQQEREFIANASHELLTPVSILQHKLENLHDHAETSPELQVKFYEMQKTISRLKNIIKTLLLISRIENEQFIKEESVSVKTLLDEVIDEISYRLEDKEIQLALNLTDDFICHPCNKSLLFNMFFNLINNAIKYNKTGGKICINGQLQTEHYQLEFTDTGIGIAPERISAIFYRFKKISRGTAESFGLGLPIVQTIANYHQIKIEVSSVVDEGSTFRLLFPR